VNDDVESVAVDLLHRISFWLPNLEMFNCNGPEALRNLLRRCHTAHLQNAAVALLLKVGNSHVRQDVDDCVGASLLSVPEEMSL